MELELKLDNVSKQGLHTNISLDRKTSKSLCVITHLD